MNDNKIKVSIIVPAYNIANYISKCLNSLINQTYNNIEIIIIDDGSVDNLKKIIEKDYLKDNRVKYYYKKNGGLSSARNYGITKTTGDFIMFVDGDDYISERSIEFLINNIGSNDIACFNYIIVNEKGTQNVQPKYFKQYDNVTNYFLTQPSACTKIYRRSLLDNIKFDLNIRYEDLAIIPSLGMHTNKIIFLDKYLYYYYIRGNSIMHGLHFSEKIDDKFTALDLLKERICPIHFEEFEYIVLKQLCIIYVTEFIKYNFKICKPRLKRVYNYLKDNNIKLNNKYFCLEPNKNKLFVYLVMHKRLILLKLLTFIKNIFIKVDI